MRKLLYKECKLTASALTYVFLAGALLTLCPGYPILVSTVFVCLGIFQTFLSAREANDILYTALLPVPKKDVVKGRFAFCVFVEMCAFCIAAAATLLRMTVFADAAVYRQNVLMNANLVYLAFVLLIYGCFHAVFVAGFFKTAYRFSGPFVRFLVITFLLIGAGETLWHIPGCEAAGAFGFDHIGLQAAALAVGAGAYLLLTITSVRRAIRYFERIDL